MQIYILVLQGVFDTGLAALIDVFALANELAKANAVDLELNVHLVGIHQVVHTAQGLTAPTRPADALVDPDVVLVPALGAKMPHTLTHALRSNDITQASLWLKGWVDTGALVGAACTGAFVLAESGLLDGHQATTSWWLGSFFQQRYPNIHLDESRMLVHSAQFVTAGATLAHFDLALSVVRSMSPAIAALVGRYLLVESRPSQASLVIPDHVAHTDPIVQRFERWARAHLNQGFSMNAAALAVGASERTLGRRLQATLGKSPLTYFQDLRVERAVHLLQTSSESVDQIASLVGYADGATLRTLLRRKLGKRTRDLRVH